MAQLLGFHGAHAASPASGRTLQPTRSRGPLPWGGHFPPSVPSFLHSTSEPVGVAGGLGLSSGSGSPLPALWAPPCSLPLHR